MYFVVLSRFFRLDMLQYLKTLQVEAAWIFRGSLQFAVHCFHEVLCVSHVLQVSVRPQI